jgi:hypothetical protein
MKKPDYYNDGEDGTESFLRLVVGLIGFAIGIYLLFGI